MNSGSEFDQLDRTANTTSQLPDTPVSIVLANQEVQRTPAILSQTSPSQERMERQQNIEPYQTYVKVGHIFSLDQLQDRSRGFQGQVGGAKFEPVPQDQTTTYRVGKTKDDSKLIQGVINSNALAAFMNGR